ncbi:MAG: hypothetical protein WB780_10020 [Candidatus Acidiferrales bacterium]
MYCEINVYHKKTITADKLAEILRGSGCGNEIPIADAYTRSTVYGGKNPYGSTYAHDSGQHCFAIVQKINNLNQSIFHFEADPHISANTLLESAEEYAQTLQRVFAGPNAPRHYRVTRLVIRPFENNFKESGLEGSLVTTRQALKDVNLFHEVGTKLIALFTTFLLVRLGLTKETITAAEWTFAIAVMFVAVELIRAWYQNRGKISWKRR